MTLLLMTGIISFFSCSKDDNNPVVEEVVPKPVNDLIEISIKSLPQKTVYTLDEQLDLTGLVVEGKYTDNTKVAINIKKEDINGFKSDVATEELTLTIMQGKLTVSFSVQVLPIKVTDGVLTEVVGKVTEITLPDFITSIGKDVFKGSQVTKVTLNEGLISIGSQAFGWSRISEINFPKSLRQIDEAAFYRCENLSVVDLSQTALTKIVHESFSYCSGITELKLPAGLKEIEYQAFIESLNLKELTLPEGLRALGNEAFRGTGLVSLRLPNSVCSMDQRAFYHASDLEAVETYGAVLPENNEIECIMQASTFEGCGNLKSFAIPGGVKIVGQNTLSKSPALTSMVIPATVRQINFNAFGNSSLQTVIVEGTTPAKAALATTAWYGFPSRIESIKVPAGTADAYKNATGWKEFANVISE